MFFTPALPATNNVTTVPAPIGGLNARDSLAAMPETDAVILENWWPQPYGCSFRNGYREWTTGLPANAGTLATWSGRTGTQALFAWANTGMYDITTRGVVGAAIVTGLAANVTWQSVQMNNAAANTLVAVNGTDNPIFYNGAVGRYTGVDWTGVTPSTLIQVTIHQKRLWAVQKDTAFGWFLAPDAVVGAFQRFDFGPLFSRGGYLQFLSTWTLDDGNGAEDHLVGVSSEGEAVVYGGTDPTDDTKWALVGVYYIGKPVSGYAGFSKVGGDLYILTQQGVVSMAAQLISTKVSEAQEKLVTDKIQFRISDLMSRYSASAGWNMEFYAKYNMLLISVPALTLGTDTVIQLACNTITNAWTQFSGMSATAWGALTDEPYFADKSGNVNQAWYGTLDGVLLDNTGGNTITTAVLQAYSYLNSGATQKQVDMYRPNFLVANDLTYTSTILYDFNSSALNIGSAPTLDPTSLWDTAIWDIGLWRNSSTYLQKQWNQGEGMGVAAALNMLVRSNAGGLWVSTDYSFKAGVGLF